MADADKTLKLLIELGVVGKDDARAAQQLLKETTDSTQEAAKATAALGDSEKETGGKAEHAGISHRALNRTLGELNRVVPGLGTALEFLAHGYQHSAEGAEAATVANDELLVSMGELAVVFLAIQAATEYWNLYKESSEAALKAQTEATTKLDDATKKMIESRDKFNEAMNRGVEPAERINKQLDLQTKIVEAQIKAERELLKAREDAELAGAKTPEQKSEIKRRYETALDQTEDQGDAAKTNLIEQAKLKAQSQQAELQTQLDNLTQRQLELTRGSDKTIPATPDETIIQTGGSGLVFPVTVPGVPAHNEHQSPSPGDLDAAQNLDPKIEELRKEILDLKKAQENYSDRVSESKTVGDINKSGRTAVEKTQDSSRVISDAEAIADKGPKNDAEQQFILRITQLASGQALNLQQAEAYLQNLQKHPEALGRIFDRLLAYNVQVFDRLIDFDRQLQQYQSQLGQTRNSYGGG